MPSVVRHKRKDAFEARSDESGNIDYIQEEEEVSEPEGVVPGLEPLVEDEDEGHADEWCEDAVEGDESIGDIAATRASVGVCGVRR